MRPFWQPVARSVDLPLGKSKPITVMPPYPALEGEGLIECYATLLPVNDCQSCEND